MGLRFCVELLDELLEFLVGVIRFDPLALPAGAYPIDEVVLPA